MAADEAGEDERWSALHDGVRPSPVVRGWLRLVRLLASGPVLRMPPDALSAAGVLTLAAAWACAAVLDVAWPVVPLVLAAGLLDGLDGAVALRTGRARPLGAVVDAMADRLGDLLLGAVLVALGAPVGWVVAAVTVVLLHEYLRSRAQAVGMPGVGTVTVAERPTRLILVGLAAAGAAVFPAGVPPVGWSWGWTFAAAWTAVGAAGLVQLVIGVRRTVPREFPPPR